MKKTATHSVEGVDAEDPLAAVAEGEGLGGIDVKVRGHEGVTSFVQKC